MALAHAIAMGIMAASNAKRNQIRESCSICGKIVSVTAGQNATMVCKSCGHAFCVRTCGQPFACGNCLDKLPDEVKDPFITKFKQLKTLYYINLAILLILILSFPLYLLTHYFSPLYWLIEALAPAMGFGVAMEVAFAIFGLNLVPAIVAMSVSFSQARRKTERLFRENPVANQNPAIGMPGAPGSGTMEPLFPSNSAPLPGNQTLNQGAQVATAGTRFCAACGSNLEDNMCFNCGAKNCPSCGFANTGADLARCEKCGIQM